MHGAVVLRQDTTRTPMFISYTTLARATRHRPDSACLSIFTMSMAGAARAHVSTTRRRSVIVFDGLVRERGEGSLCASKMGSRSYVQELFISLIERIVHARTRSRPFGKRWYLTWARNYFNRPFGI
jgi:hypothetical protein